MPTIQTGLRRRSDGLLNVHWAVAYGRTACALDLNGQVDLEGLESDVNCVCCRQSRLFGTVSPQLAKMRAVVRTTRDAVRQAPPVVAFPASVESPEVAKTPARRIRL